MRFEDGGKRERFVTYVNPGRSIPTRIQQMTASARPDVANRACYRRADTGNPGLHRRSHRRGCRSQRRVRCFLPARGRGEDQHARTRHVRTGDDFASWAGQLQSRRALPGAGKSPCPRRIAPVTTRKRPPNCCSTCGSGSRRCQARHWEALGAAGLESGWGPMLLFDDARSAV